MLHPAAIRQAFDCTVAHQLAAGTFASREALGSGRPYKAEATLMLLAWLLAQQPCASVSVCLSGRLSQWLNLEAIRVQVERLAAACEDDHLVIVALTSLSYEHACTVSPARQPEPEPEVQVKFALFPACCCLKNLCHWGSTSAQQGFYC